MPSVIEFVIGLLVLLTVWLLWSLRGENIKEYFRTRDGLGILKGIVLAVGFAVGLAVLFSLNGCSGTYLNDASVYAGLERTKKLSPQCEPTGADDRTTSNLGVRVNLYESTDERFRTNAKYTHHSCAFSPDDRSYDALGVELEYKLWDR
jgi:hypothetical protein